MEKHGVIRSAGLVGGLTLVSRGMGLIRDVLQAGFFGTSLAMSAFVIAFRVPNLFRALFGEGALSAAFIPVFVETRHRDGDEAAWKLARQVFKLVGLTLLLITLAGMAAASLALLSPGLSPKAELMWSLLRIMLPYMIFICLAAVSMAVLNSFHHFAVPAATPWILNAVLIVALLFVCPRLGATQEEQIYGVAWAVVVAGVLQFAAQWPVLAKYGFRWRRESLRGEPRLLQMLALMGPAALGRGVTQVNVMIDSGLALAIGAWAPAALYWSERLIYLPMGIFATALGTVLLPLFSGHAARGDHAALREAVNHALRLLMFLMIPAAAGLFVLSEPICRTIFEWRNFGPDSTTLTARALCFYAPGMVVFALGKVFVPVFYALQDPKTPVRVSVATVLLNIGLSVAFMLTWPLYYKHAGIAFATVLAEGLNGAVMARLIHRRLGSPGWGAVARSVGRTVAAAAAMAAAAAAVNATLLPLLVRAGLLAKLAQIGALGAAIAAGGIVYLVAAKALHSPELADVLAALRRRRRAPSATEPEAV